MNRVTDDGEVNQIDTEFVAWNTGGLRPSSLSLIVLHIGISLPMCHRIVCQHNLF